MRAHRSRPSAVRKLIAAALAVCAAAAGLAVTATPAGAATFTVTTTADTVDGVCDAHCSLRDAIVAANANQDHDTISLQPGGVYLIPDRAGSSDDSAAVGDLDITSPITLLGNGARLPDGDRWDAARPDVHPGASLVVDSITFEGGQSSIVTRAGGFTQISRSTLNSVVSLGTTFIYASTLVGIRGFGGESLVAGGDVYLQHVTMASGSHIEDRGGHVRAAATLLPLTCPMDVNGFQTDLEFTSLGWNVGGDTRCPLGLDQPTDQPTLVDDPRNLGSWEVTPRFAGGPTQTLPLLDGSPAIDAVPLSSGLCAGTDQRGITRPVGPACDIGAYEADHPNPQGFWRVDGSHTLQRGGVTYTIAATASLRGDEFTHGADGFSADMNRLVWLRPGGGLGAGTLATPVGSEFTWELGLVSWRASVSGTLEAVPSGFRISGPAAFTGQPIFSPTTISATGASEVAFTYCGTFPC